MNMPSLFEVGGATKMPSSFKVGGATKMPVGAGVVCTETSEILSSHLNCKIRVVDDALGFSVLPSDSSDPVLFVSGLCNNVIHNEQEHSPISTKSALDGYHVHCIFGHCHEPIIQRGVSSLLPSDVGQEGPYPSKKSLCCIVIS